ncbi:MAG TPA: NmrA family NAD(P)-binding protein [Thermoanaerobaculia bacterium]
MRHSRETRRGGSRHPSGSSETRPLAIEVAGSSRRLKILVTGGTGTVGSRVARELLARGADVTILTRDLSKAKALLPEIRAVQGDLLDPVTIRSAFPGMDGLFLLNALGTSETHEGLMAVNGARLSGIRRIAYLSVHRVDEAAHLPHFGSKIAVETVLRDSGIPSALIRANNYFQNDYWYKDVILGFGIYPQPLGDVGVSRVDIRDIAEAAAITLLSGADGIFNVVGPEPQTGKSTAAIWAKALGKAVAYGGNELDAWEKQAAQMLPPWLAFDLRLMYAHFGQKGLVATAADVQRLTKLLGHPPRRFEDFAAETARAWKS